MVDIKPEKLLLPEEVDIYEQGLKQDFDAGLIGRWIGKFEGVCDLSMRWESGDNDFYKDYLLDEVFDNCIRKLKKPGRVFGSVEAMNRYFTEHMIMPILPESLQRSMQHPARQRACGKHCLLTP